MTHKNLILCTFSLFAFACSPKATNEQENASNDLITVTSQQLEAEHIELGHALAIPFFEFVTCTGTLEAKPNGITSISTSIEGRIHAIRCIQGQRVKKGQTLFEISGNEMIEIQRAYTEAASRLKRLTSEYERTKTLYSEQIGAEKEFLAIESEYHIAKANYSALKLKIEQMNLKAAALEEGNFQPYFAITSPHDGIASDIQVAAGQYINPQTPLTEIIDPQKIQLQLSCFESDWSRLKVNQTVYFKLLNNNQSFEATLTSLGTNINLQSKTLTANAQPKTTITNFVNHAFVEAQIATAVDTVMAVPEEAILKLENQHYILLWINNKNDNHYFKPLKIKTGRTYNGWIEIIETSELGKIMTKGVYNFVIE